MSNLLKSQCHIFSQNQQHLCKDVLSVIHEMIHKLPLTRDWLISNHEQDCVIQSTGIWYPQKAEKVLVCYYKIQGIIMKQWRPRDTHVDY